MSGIVGQAHSKSGQIRAEGLGELDEVHYGDITDVSGATCVTWKRSGAFFTPKAITADILIVGGGGAGGKTDWGSSGGGGGGVFYLTSQTIAAGYHEVHVGEGGASGMPGDDSWAFGIKAGGGGRGGIWDERSLGNDRTWKNLHGRYPGGSGAGGMLHQGSSTIRGEWAQGDNADGYYGNNGGTSDNHDTGGRSSAGGGGAGTAGTNASGNTAGAGGAGKQINIDGNNYYYAGGGGGGTNGTAGGAGGIGGGGGGNTSGGTAGAGGGSAQNTGGAGNSDGTAAAGNGGANTGGGGGGTGYPNRAGGHGGSGIVIIKYTHS